MLLEMLTKARKNKLYMVRLHVNPRFVPDGRPPIYFEGTITSDQYIELSALLKEWLKKEKAGPEGP